MNLTDANILHLLTMNRQKAGFNSACPDSGVLPGFQKEGEK